VTIRARGDAADAEDSPAWTLSPSPERSGEKEGASAARRPSPASRSPLSMSPALDVAFESYRGAGSYRERRDARKASKAFGDEDAGGAARTGLDVRGDTSGAVFY
jgi:hypothetical protein